MGAYVSSDGHIEDVLVGSTSDKAGLGPGMQIVAVNGRQFIVVAVSGGPYSGEYLAFALPRTG